MDGELQMTKREELTVNVFWPGEGYGIPERVETMEEAYADARRLVAMGYGAKSKSTRPNEIHIVKVVRETTVWSESDGDGG